MLRIIYLAFLVGLNVVIISGIAVHCTECTQQGETFDYTYKTVWTVLYVISLVINFINVGLYCWVIRQIQRKTMFNQQFMTEYEDPTRYKR